MSFDCDFSVMYLLKSGCLRKLASSVPKRNFALFVPLFGGSRTLHMQHMKSVFSRPRPHHLEALVASGGKSNESGRV